MTVTYLLTLHLHLMPTMSLSAAAQSPDPPPPSLPSLKDVLFNTAILLGHQDWFKLLQGDGTEMTITEKQVYLPTNPKPKKEVLHDCTCFWKWIIFVQSVISISCGALWQNGHSLYCNLLPAIQDKQQDRNDSQDWSVICKETDLIWVSRHQQHWEQGWIHGIVQESGVHRSNTYFCANTDIGVGICGSSVWFEGWTEGHYTHW